MSTGMSVCTNAVDVTNKPASSGQPLMVLTESQVADLIDLQSVREQLRAAFQSCGTGGTGLGERPVRARLRWAPCAQVCAHVTHFSSPTGRET